MAVRVAGGIYCTAGAGLLGDRVRPTVLCAPRPGAPDRLGAAGSGQVSGPVSRSGSGFRCFNKRRIQKSWDTPHGRDAGCQSLRPYPTNCCAEKA